MTLSAMLIIAVCLSADSYGAAVSKGAKLENAGAKQMLKTGAVFGLFQALLPLLGFVMGGKLLEHTDGELSGITKWIALAAVVGAGVKLAASFFSKKEITADSSMKFKELIVPAVISSTGALLAGVGYAFAFGRMNFDVLYASLAGFVAAAVLSAAGIKIGKKSGVNSAKRVKFMCGLIVIFMGFKALI